MAIDMRDETIRDLGDCISELEKEKKKLQDEIKSFRARALRAEMTVFRMLKWGNKYISEAWDEYDERLERKQAWDAIVAKYTESGNDQCS